MLRRAGVRAVVAKEYSGQEVDLLLALHAGKSARSVESFRRAHPEGPIVVALTGTDVYRELARSTRAKRTLEIADRLVVLQPLALRELPPAARGKAKVILQSVERAWPGLDGRGPFFEVLVLTHLRPVKDPLRVALAARRLPASSRIRVTHLGAAMSPALERRARAETDRNHRYRWIGDRSHPEAMRRLARARLLVLTSRLEGGANVISEAVAHGVPVLSSRIAGSLGLLGRDYMGFFEAGDSRGLAVLMRRAEIDPRFLGNLRRHCRRLASLFEPARELAAWRTLLRELGFAQSDARRGHREIETKRRSRRKRRTARPEGDEPRGFVRINPARSSASARGRACRPTRPAASDLR
jgi:putative glycosyltransferase (TIGR04348 family)